MPQHLNEIIVDLTIVVILLFSIYRGFKNGFIVEFMRFFATYVSLVLAIRHMSDLAVILFGATDALPHSVITVIAFLLIFVPLMLIFRFITHKLKLVSRFSITLGSVDRLAGIAIGLLKGAVFVSIITIVVSLTGLSNIFRQQLETSMLYQPMREILPLVYKTAKMFVWTGYKPFHEELRESLNIKTQRAIDKRSRDTLEYYQEKNPGNTF